MTNAVLLAPAQCVYRGNLTRPERWAAWMPRRGDVLVTTPSKCGTTWTQTMVAHLLHGGRDLPDKLPVISPWIDADLGVPMEQVARALDAQTGRRVVKTHTPADGFPVWGGVTVIAVYRHPLDMFFSLRKHTANRTNAPSEDPTGWPLAPSFHAFVHDPMIPEDLGQDNLESMTLHFSRTVQSGRLPDLKLFHYADMIRDPRRAVQNLARAIGIDADDALIDRVTQAASFGAMKAKAADFAPVGGSGFWKSDANFFDSASSRKWEGILSDDDLAQYRQRLAELLPDAASREFIEHLDV